MLLLQLSFSNIVNRSCISVGPKFVLMRKPWHGSASPQLCLFVLLPPVPLVLFPRCRAAAKLFLCKRFWCSVAPEVPSF